MLASVRRNTLHERFIARRAKLGTGATERIICNTGRTEIGRQGIYRGARMKRAAGVGGELGIKVEELIKGPNVPGTVCLFGLASC